MTLKYNMRENNPVLTIEIRDRMLRCFAMRLFRETDAGYLVSNWSAAGAVLCSLVEPANNKIIVEASEYSIDLVLPLSDITGRLRGRFVQLSEDDHSKFITVLKREFHLTFITYIAEGGVAGFTKKQCIDMFIVEYGLSNIPTAFDTLTKKRQRTTAYAVRDFNRRLQKMTSYHTQKVKKQLKNNT